MISTSIKSNAKQIFQLHNLSAFQLWATNFLTCFNLTEYNSCTFRAAFRAAFRALHGSRGLHVTMSESIHQLMHRGGMMQSWSVTQTGNTWHRQDAHNHRHASSNWHCQDSVVHSLPLWMCQSKPVSRPRLKDACRPLSVSSYSVIHADLSWSRSRDRESYFQQQGFPSHCSFIRDQSGAWPLTPNLWPLCVRVARGSTCERTMNHIQTYEPHTEQLLALYSHSKLKSYN